MPILKFKDFSINYDVKGEGEPILLLNGLMMSIPSWEMFVPAFTQSNKLIRLDFIDQGFSSRANDKYDLKLQSEVVKALLDELKIDKISIVGISYGAQVGLTFATMFKDHLAKLVVANASYKTSPWLSDIGRAWIKAAESKNGETFYYTTIPTIYSPSFYQSRIDWFKTREKILVPLFANEVFINSTIRLINSSEQFDLTDQLPSLDNNVLIIGADNDYITPFLEQENMHRLIPNSEIIKFINCGHASMYEKPNLFASAVLGFVNNKAGKIVI